MRNLDINLLRQAAQLMKEFELDELACEEFTIKKSKHKQEKKELTEQEMLQKHLEPLPAEPWMTISDGQLDEFVIKGKV